LNELITFFQTTGLMNIGWQQIVMLAVGGVFIFLAIQKHYEPYELLPIGFGILLANLPLAGLTLFVDGSARE
jgi:oxaloacetate decarboxylase beta subunit